LKHSFPGDRLVAEAVEDHSSNRISVYDIKVYNDKTRELIARSIDQAYRKDQWFVEPEGFSS
jgi:acyl-coenzyme A thioesterase PaaI-like protein